MAIQYYVFIKRVGKGGRRLWRELVTGERVLIEGVACGMRFHNGRWVITELQSGGTLTADPLQIDALTRARKQVQNILRKHGTFEKYLSRNRFATKFPLENLPDWEE